VDPATSSAAVSASPTTPVAAITEIPAAAFLQVGDLGAGGSLAKNDEVVPPGRMDPCKSGVPASESMIAVQKWILALYRFTDNRESYTNRKIPDGTAYEVITSYFPGGSEAYLAEQRDMVKRCPKIHYTTPPGVEDHKESTSYAIVAEHFAGDDALMISQKWSGVYYNTLKTDTSFFAVVRIGDALVTINADGWEQDSADRRHVDRLVAAALRRAAPLLKS